MNEANIMLRPGEREEILRHRKRNARSLLHRAVKSGQVVKQNCVWFSCRKSESEAHHPNYDYPLSVIWLCRKHHMMHHWALSNSSRSEAYEEMLGLDTGQLART